MKLTRYLAALCCILALLVARNTNGEARLLQLLPSLVLPNALPGTLPYLVQNNAPANETGRCHVVRPRQHSSERLHRHATHNHALVLPMTSQHQAAGALRSAVALVGVLAHADEYRTADVQTPRPASDCIKWRGPRAQEIHAARDNLTGPTHGLNTYSSAS
ncbi:hypothetical protein [Hymenobacter sp. B81]|uniref:hypothetical protein n=1 Tax=Hymenobacter sp. B81 TaxID=3344878 RepID=UPI0037DC4835